MLLTNSNGSGKSSLAMATLWALTGTLDPRPMQDAKVADVVNNDSKVSALCFLLLSFVIAHEWLF
jgi:DNA repair exonuclease SbcCD ATPase subunit